MIVPVNADGKPLIDITQAASTRRGQKIWSADENITFSYGDDLMMQQQPTQYYLPFDTKFDAYGATSALLLSSVSPYNVSYPAGFEVFDMESYLIGHGYSDGGGSTFSGITDIGLRRTDGQIQRAVKMKTAVTTPEVSIDIPVNTYVKNAS